MSDGGDKTVEDLRREVHELKEALKREKTRSLGYVRLDEVPAGMVRVSPEGAIVAANKVALDFLGLTFDAATKKYTADFVARREDGEVEDWSDFPVTKALTTGKPSGPNTYGVERPDGTTRWGVFHATPVLTEDGKVDGATVGLVDISARRRAEMKLRDSELRLWSLLEATPAHIIYVDSELKIQFINRYEFGHTADTVNGRPIEEFLAPEDRERVVGVLREVLATGEHARYEVPPNEGTYNRWFATDVGPLRRGGEIVGLVLISRDITERVAMQSRLLVADKLASLGALAAGVAHEVNNPLTYVMASLQRIQRQVTGEGVKWVDSAIEGAERIRDVVRDLSSLSGQDARRNTALDLRPVLEASARMARSELQYRARLSTKLGPVPKVLADKSRLGQVFLNILINAAQSIPVGDAEFNEVSLETSTGENGWAVVEIRDTGSGIPPEVVDRIFEPFVTTKGETGTGLGLFLCASIVRDLGGNLTVAANGEQGTCFRLELPPAPVSDRSRRQRKRSDSGRRSAGRARVLVVDDEAGVLGFLEDALSEHDVVLANSGMKALELVGAGDFDIIFCDLIMPDVSGMEVFRCLVDERPDLVDRVVFMTGGAFTPRAQEFLRDKAQPLLEKPFDIAEVLDHVARAVAGRQSS